MCFFFCGLLSKSNTFFFFCFTSSVSGTQSKCLGKEVRGYGSCCSFMFMEMWLWTSNFIIIDTRESMKLLFFVPYSLLCCHCGNLTRGSCLLSPFHFKLFRYFLCHVACQNLSWQLGLIGGTILTCLEYPSKRDLVFNKGCSHCKHIKSSYAAFLSRCTILHPNKQ